MIINFSVKNFGCIKDEVTLSFEANKSDDLEEYYIIEPKKGLRLLKLGLIFGANASGKTTVLEALDFLGGIVSNPLSKKTDTFDFQPFLFDEKTSTQNTVFQIEFITEEAKYDYSVELNKVAIVNEKLDFYSPRKANVYSRTTDLDSQLSKIKFGSKIDIDKNTKSILEINTLWNNTVIGAYLKSNVDLEILGDVLYWFMSKLSPTIMSDFNLLSYAIDRVEKENIDKLRMIGLLKKADFNVADFFIEKRNLDFNSRRSKRHQHSSKSVGIISIMREVMFQHQMENGETYSLSYDRQSRGTQRYFQLANLFDDIIENNLIIPIDELESSLHPDLLEHFLLVFLVNAKNSQLIATTHYRELLMKKDILRPDAIWFTEKKPDGGTDLYSLDDFDTSVIRPDTGSIYNAYKIGKLGATPNLGDYYIDLEDGKA